MCYPLSGVRKLSSVRSSLRFGAVLLPLGSLTVAAAVVWAVAQPSSSAADPAPTTEPVVATAPRATLDTDKARGIVRALAKTIEDADGSLGASVVVIADGREIGAHRSSVAMNPASNAKLPTAAAALEILGAEHRFVTGLYGRIEDGRVDELTLRGRGDPTLTTADLRGLAHHLVVAGVKKVDRIAVDQSYFGDAFVPPAFEQQPNEWAAFRAPTAAVSLERNTMTLWVRPASEAKGKATIFVDPPGFVDIEGSVRTGSKDSAERLIADLEPKADHLSARVGGSVPLGSKPVPVTKRVDDPRALAGYALRAALEEQGIDVTGNVEARKTKESRALALRSSPPLAEIVPRLGKESDNFTAEMLLLAIGAEANKEPSADAGVQAVSAFLGRRGALGEGTVVKNGSGLFDANRISASSLTTLLVSVAKDSKLSPEFLAHLSIGGVDGTLRSRFRSLREARSVRAKTGTLADVVALSGYVMDDQGQPALAFSFLTSGVRGKTHKARTAMDKAVTDLAKAIRR